MEEEQHVPKSDATTPTVISALVPQPTNAIAAVLHIMLITPTLANYALTPSLTAPFAHTLAHSAAQLVLVDTILAQVQPAQLAQLDKPTAFIAIQQVLDIYGALIA